MAKEIVRWGSAGLALIISATLLSGCGDAAQKAEIKELKTTVEALEQENLSLQEYLDGMSITEVRGDSSLQVVDGKTVPEFVTIEGKLKLPNRLKLPNASDDANNSNILVGSQFKYTPSSNWLVKMNGATLELTHPSKIWGTVKAVKVLESVLEPEMQGILQSFFSGYPTTTISYRKVFMDDRVVGMIADAEITVDSKPYMLNVGFVTRGEFGQLYLFTYEITEQAVQQELIDLLVNSGRYGDSKIAIE